MLLVGFFTTLLALGLFRKAESLFAYFSPNTNNKKASFYNASHTFTVLSLLAEAMYCPLLAHATAYTQLK